MRTNVVITTSDIIYNNAYQEGNKGFVDGYILKGREVLAIVVMADRFTLVPIEYLEFIGDPGGSNKG